MSCKFFFKIEFGGFRVEGDVVVRYSGKFLGVLSLGFDIKLVLFLGSGKLIGFLE